MLRDSGGGGLATGARPANRIPLADVSPYGANFFLEREPDAWTQEQTVEMAAAAGLKWAKQHFLWSEIEPQKGSFVWDKYDRIVDLLRAHGLEVIARLDWSPPWVREDYQPGLNNPPSDVSDYARFVAQTVSHFRGRVRFYQIWNEPNLLSEWGNRLDRPVDPGEYVQLLAAAAAAARAADPDAAILSAPLAINLENISLAGNMSDLDYLEGMYEAGAASHFDILGANAFGMDLPPQDPPSADRLDFRRVELQRQIMVRHGDGMKAVWLNEYGWNAAPATMAPDLLLWQRVTEAQQAAWTVEGIRWAETNWPWAGVLNIWYFRQWGGKTPAEADYYFRMVDPDFTPRRLYGAVRAAATAPAIASAGEWSERSPPVDLGDLSSWRWTWADGATDRSALVSNVHGASLAFAYRGAAASVRARLGPTAGNLALTVDGRRADGASAAVSLRDAQVHWEWLPVADGLSDGSHRLELKVVGDGEVAIDGFRVGSRPPGAAKGLGGRLLGLLVVALALLLLVDGRRIVRRARV
jgi:hypothetical protein